MAAELQRAATSILRQALDQCSAAFAEWEEWDRDIRWLAENGHKPTVKPRGAAPPDEWRLVDGFWVWDDGDGCAEFEEAIEGGQAGIVTSEGLVIDPIRAMHEGRPIAMPRNGDVCSRRPIPLSVIAECLRRVGAD